MVWICDICQRPNNFEIGQTCQYRDRNNQQCRGNLEMMDSFDLKEMSQKEFQETLEEQNNIIAQFVENAEDDDIDGYENPKVLVSRMFEALFLAFLFKQKWTDY